MPPQDELQLTPNAAYVHFTSNNTHLRDAVEDRAGVGTTPLVCDTSSDIFSRPIDVARYGLIYAGAQKNLGPVGCHARHHPRRSAAALREVAADDAQLRRARGERVDVQHPAVLRHLPDGSGREVGLGARRPRVDCGVNERKAGKLYAEIDRTGFYRGTAEKDSRSLMNVTFKLRDEALDKAFVKESTAAGFDGLKGHRSVGGMRASIYNAFPEEGVDALVEFMRDFERKHG